MDSTVMRSPPTSAAIEARSCVAVMTLSLSAACPTFMQKRRMARSGISAGLVISYLFLERVRSVGADGELELEQELVGGQVLAILRAPELAADLAELAG